MYQPHKAYQVVEFCPLEKEIATSRAENSLAGLVLYFEKLD